MIDTPSRPGPWDVVGIDGCPGGRWALASATALPAPDRWAGFRFVGVEVSVLDDLRPVVHDVRTATISAAAIDMPIGLLDHHPRPADVAVRKLLGPRRSSVFPTPVRAVLGSVTYEDACARSRAACGKALSRQSYNLLDRITELDRLIEPGDQDRLVEAHPELAFSHLAGAPMATNKYRSEGSQERRRILGRMIGASVLDALLATRSAPQPDVLDALVLLSVAARVAAGSAQRIGSSIDATGKRAEVVV